MMKPFKPPTIVGRSSVPTERPSQPAEPPTKKRRISEDISDGHEKEVTGSVPRIPSSQRLSKSLPSFQAPVRKPLDEVRLNANGPAHGTAPTDEAYFTVLWRNFTMKKNKTWDGDGVLRVEDGYATLLDVSGRELGRVSWKGPLSVDSELSVPGKVIKVESTLSKQDYAASKQSKSVKKGPGALKETTETERKLTKVQIKPHKIPELRKQSLVELAAQAKSKTKIPDLRKNAANLPAPSAKPPNAAFKAPLLESTVQQANPNSRAPVARHDPNAEKALVMKRPATTPKGKQLVDVVVDPLLTKHLRDHQRAGVSFLYECVMGMKDYDGLGAVLADEMGMGKTLQVIALLWTLLKQNPVWEEPPVIKKALIVCPATLIQNWRTEFRKWLGKDRLGVYVLDDKSKRLTEFTMGRSFNVMIISYERLRNVQEDLKKGAGVDIVIADEGHRMKTSQNKAALAIKSLNTDRRIILSGTPIQNDLAEFYQMVDFVNPGLLKKYSTFKKDFENPILKSQQPGVSASDQEKGEARSEELAKLTSMFILRRTVELLSDYLPTKTEYVVFCKPTQAQCSVYKSIIKSPVFNAALGSSHICLELISILKKVCNSPNLLLKKADNGEDKTKAEVLEHIPPSLLKSPGASGKLQVLDSLLHRIRTTTEEKVVLVSNYTSTLDILGNLLTSMSYKYLRLDGSTPQSKRLDLVNRFNKSSATDSFVFLLSAKAGGVGLNLIGASRLILFDLDWNPATDLQAMARVYRDGQKRPCFIYRLLTAGALDEKIYQRQVSKTGLSDSIVDGKSSVSGFTREELRDLFSLDESNGCQTHKLLGCGCGGNGMPMTDSETDDTSPRNDLALLSNIDNDKVRNKDGIEVLRLDSEDEPSSSMRGSWKSAKDFDASAEDRDARECKDSTGKAKMLSLMQYAHFDASLVNSGGFENVVDVEDGDEMPPDDPLEGVIEDSILRNVLREEGGRIAYVFSRLGN